MNWTYSYAIIGHWFPTYLIYFGMIFEKDHCEPVNRSSPHQITKTQKKLKPVNFKVLMHLSSFYALIDNPAPMGHIFN